MIGKVIRNKGISAIHKRFRFPIIGTKVIIDFRLVKNNDILKYTIHYFGRNTTDLMLTAMAPPFALWKIFNLIK